jgi:hypothetical protein
LKIKRTSMPGGPGIPGVPANPGLPIEPLKPGNPGYPGCPCNPSGPDVEGQRFSNSSRLRLLQVTYEIPLCCLFCPIIIILVFNIQICIDCQFFISVCSMKFGKKRFLTIWSMDTKIETSEQTSLCWHFVVDWYILLTFFLPNVKDRFDYITFCYLHAFNSDLKKNCTAEKETWGLALSQNRPERKAHIHDPSRLQSVRSSESNFSKKKKKRMSATFDLFWYRIPSALMTFLYVDPV